MALEGAVVSKPMPRKTTFLFLFFFVISNASIVEYTILISAPLAFSLSRLEEEPGTLIRSPYVVIIISSFLESAIALSINLLLVTHTGHPGPDSNSIFSGRSDGIPNLWIDIVWPPQTSIMEIFLLEIFFISLESS